jgi:hypothetical protein
MMPALPARSCSSVAAARPVTVDLVLTIAFYCAVVRVLATMRIDNEPYYKEVVSGTRCRE